MIYIQKPTGEILHAEIKWSNVYFKSVLRFWHIMPKKIMSEEIAWFHNDYVGYFKLKTK